ncbi:MULTISPECIES: hypothetical protein [Pseudonocardia]|uniref:Uncharacterized protein n=2 Tax=Pseudonocardia TaxID=1847 RepID=A0A1Y2N096_PSEAH|nr:MULTISPECIES: hypothetical protein [Pseudonocardia]OSY40840.1 hypothetical protein BG845_02599 [Pseudonocardia autotrophica]TDN71852.1 hypothetical protein C8E95_0887 [Pseudonocardia autotrophica]BBG02540.1 hypothetical protein Pdca_37490 [Pseudonocardia autotrophica]GEC29303.1 hypothetical protein PSA01_63320 [Pseudonocardia saturnea]
MTRPVAGYPAPGAPVDVRERTLHVRCTCGDLLRRAPIQDLCAEPHGEPTGMSLRSVRHPIPGSHLLHQDPPEAVVAEVRNVLDTGPVERVS